MNGIQSLTKSESPSSAFLQKLSVAGLEHAEVFVPALMLLLLLLMLLLLCWRS